MRRDMMFVQIIRPSAASKVVAERTAKFLPAVRFGVSLLVVNRCEGCVAAVEFADYWGEFGRDLAHHD
jgi:hypothetical protein